MSSSILWQHLLPKQALTSLMGAFARRRVPLLTPAFMRWFAGRYHVNLAEAAEPSLDAYCTFNEFFTRPLREGARPIAAAALVSPVDGAVSECGPIERDQIFQAKGHRYSTAALLGGDAAAARAYEDGSFATIYLSPRDYHRIHMPCAGHLVRMVHVPGALYSVNPSTVRALPGLFARNERVVCHFEGERGPFVLVLVGATIVGSMATSWHGVVNPPRPGIVRRWEYAASGAESVHLKQGDEMGRFLLGSTVVMLFPAPQVQFPADWVSGRPVRLGEAMVASASAPRSPQASP